MFRRYKLSAYNRLVPYQNLCLLYNQISGALIVLEDSAINKYKKITQTRCWSTFTRMLVRNGFLIPSNRDEKSYMKSAYYDRVSDTTCKGLTIAVTDRCNLGCFYCYEDKKIWKDMDVLTQEKVIRFVEKHIVATPTKRFHVTWYGGEPLMNLEAVKYLSLKFKQLCEDNKIVYSQFMVTNGTLFTDEIIDELWELNCRVLQITIDGIGVINDIRRPYLEKTAGSSFGVIVDNLEKLYKKGFVIHLRSNLDLTNYKCYDDFLNFIIEKGYHKFSNNRGIIYLYPGWTNNSVGNVDFMSKEMYSKILCQVKDRLFLTGFSSSLLPVFFQGCMIHQRFGFGISQTGKLCKCWHHITDESNVVADVEDLKFAETGCVPDYGPYDDEECLNCPVLPSCSGGCETMNRKNKDCGCCPVRWTLDRDIISLYLQETQKKKTCPGEQFQNKQEAISLDH